MEERNESRGRAGRNVFLLGIVSFLNDMSSEIILPILPFFLRGFGAGYTGIGIVGGILDGFGNLVKVVSGYISDRVGNRKHIVFSGYLLSQISKLALSFSNSTALAGLFVTLDRVGKGIRTSPRDALLAESGMKSGKAFGFHRMMDTLGAVLGTSLALYLVYSGVNYSSAILFAAVIGFFAVVPLVFVRETAVPVKRPEVSFRLKKFAVFSFFVGLANISYMFFMLRAESLGVEEAIGLYLLFNVVYALCSYPFGVFAERVGKTRSLSLGYLFMTAASLSMFAGESLPLLLAGFLLYGLYMSVVEAQQRALASDLSVSYGFGMGTYHFVFGVSTIVGNTIAGMIADISLNLVFAYSAILSFTAAVLYATIKF
ncbi:MFS transporter [Geoglobus ahangari]